MTRPPRILVATPVAEQRLHSWQRWVQALRLQKTTCLLDLVVVDDTDFPQPQYVEWLRSWARSQPLGPSRRVRLKRFGFDHDGTMFIGPQYRSGYARQLIWDWFERWRSYDALLFLECDVLIPQHAIQTLYEAYLPWAAGWLVRDVQPRLWHSLTPERWNTAQPAEAAELGYLAPPGARPFPCAVTHLDCTLIRREVVEHVPLRLTSAGAAVQLSWDAASAGFPPHCVPRVDCQYLAADERLHPEYKEAVS